MPTAPETIVRSDWPAPSPGSAPPADAGAEPESLVVPMDTGERIHYLDWGDPAARQPRTGRPERRPGSGTSALPPLILLHGVVDTSWAWAPIARRLAGLTHVLAVDQRGHGLSESPATGYELPSLAIDVLTVMVANGWGPDARRRPVVLAGHGFGAVVAVAVAAERRAAVAGLALVDGGWEDVGAAVGDDPEQAVKALAEPPEVLASMEAWLADRRAFDPPSWDGDQERSARAQVEQKHAGHVVPIVRRHALAGTVAAMLSYRPAELLPRIVVPTLVVAAGAPAPDDESARDRELELGDALGLVTAPLRAVRFPEAGHNLMRYAPAALAAELVGLLRVAAS